MLRTLTELNYLASTEFGGLKSEKLPQISQIPLGNHEIHERHEVEEAKATCSNKNSGVVLRGCPFVKFRVFRG
jgi:hypothetical protein